MQGFDDIKSQTYDILKSSADARGLITQIQREISMSMNNRQNFVSSGTSWFAHLGPGRIEFDIRPIRYADRRHESPAWGRTFVGYGEPDTQWLKKLNSPATTGRRARRLRRREWD